MTKVLKLIDVLLVEDEAEIQENYKEVFKYFFNNVYVASNGKEALEIFKRRNIQAVFTDYMMPQMNGYELTLELKKINPNIPITIITNHDDRENMQKFIPLGLAGYLFKPLNYEDIKIYIENFAKVFENSQNVEYKITKNCTINFKKNFLRNEEIEYYITQLESDFLKILVTQKKDVVRYDTFYEMLYEYEPSYETLVNLVYRLKKKYNIKNIKNIKDFGYLVVDDDN
jgi:DNA-binding response OmpR family regulator